MKTKLFRRMARNVDIDPNELAGAFEQLVAMIDAVDFALAQIADGVAPDKETCQRMRADVPAVRQIFTSHMLALRQR